MAWRGVHMGAQIKLSEWYCSVRVQINVIRVLIMAISVLMNVIRVPIVVIRVLKTNIRVFPSAAHDGRQRTGCDTRCNATDDGADVAALDLEPVQYRTVLEYPA